MSTQRRSWLDRLSLCALAIAAGSILLSGQITVPNTFVNGTVADAPQVNANFNALAANALNRTGGTMTGTLTTRDLAPSADTTYSLGTHVARYVNLSTTGTTEFNTHIYSWPAVQGTASQFLSNNGSDSLSWATPVFPVDLGSCNLRLTLTSGVPVTTTDVTGATNVFVTPVRGGQCAFYDGTATWTMLTNPEITVAVPATTSTIYDLWCRNNSGTMACDTTAWTNDTTRATALAPQNNVLVKSGDTTRRFIGTFRTTAVSGRTEDSFTARYIWNYYNRVPRELKRLETTASWTYTTATFREANASTANQIGVVVGLAETAMSLSIRALVSNSGGGAVHATVGIGVDSTTTILAPSLVMTDLAANLFQPLTGTMVTTPPLGLHVYSWNEYSVASATTTWYGIDPVFGGSYYGLTGWIES